MNIGGEPFVPTDLYMLHRLLQTFRNKAKTTSKTEVYQISSYIFIFKVLDLLLTLFLSYFFLVQYIFALGHSCRTWQYTFLGRQNGR